MFSKTLNRIGVVFGLIAVVAFIGHFTHRIDLSIAMIFLFSGALLRIYFGPKIREEDVFELNLKQAKKYLKKPVYVQSYMEKHQLTYAEVKALISSGKISAFGGSEKKSIFIDEI